MNNTCLTRVPHKLFTATPLWQALFFLSALCPPVFAKDIILSGEQDGFFEKGEYLVTKTISVKKGKCISFAQGSVVRFKPYTGIVVEGSISCQGEPSSPVVFTSDQNRLPLSGAAGLPAPFDWNGIECADSSDSCVLSFVQISYSTFGVSMKNPLAKVKLDNAVFYKNGRNDLTVAGSNVSVQDNTPFFYENVPKPKPAVSAAPPALQKEPKSAPQKFPWKLTAQIGCGSLAVIGLCLGLYGHFDAEKNYSASQSAPPGAADDYWKKMQGSAVLRNVGYGMAAVGAAGFGITFFF
jgi:hypothetical protein